VTGPRVAVYHRVSTLDQDKTLARDELGAWVARQGGTVALAIEETGSGARNNRPGLRRILDAARRGEIDCVCVWKLDRWGRSTMDVLANIEALKTAGVRFVAISQGLDVKARGDAISDLILTVLAGVATFERDLIRERTLLGIAKARKRGIKLGRPRNAGPTREQVDKLREAGKSWAAIAEHYDTNVMLVRRRAGVAK
jgi:putative DNA-invertase from lambdoid prophage Rac